MAVAYATGSNVVVDGVELEPDVAARIDQLVVDEDVQLPSMFAITLTDPKRNILDRSGFGTGSAVEISIVGHGAVDDKPLLTGEVVTIECDYDEIGSRVVVRGYALSHRLHRGRRTRIFVNSTDSDIVTSIANEAGIDIGNVEATKDVHEHVTQANATDWEFLTSRARAIGFQLDMVDGRLGFHPPATSADAPPANDGDADAESRDPRLLTLGHNLLAFHGRISAAEQVAEVEVRGWDPDEKESMVATAPAATEAAELDLSDPSSLAGSFGDPRFVAVTRPLSTVAEAEGIARALADRIASSFAEADGTAIGNTALRAGAAVRISKASEEFSGAYVLSHARHVIDGVGYRTHFTISGRQNRSLLGLVASATGSGADADGSPTRGLVRGVVSANADPRKLGRVKVKLPWLDQKFSSAWAPVMQLGAGPESGTFFLPAVGDEVLVGFEHGQVDRPIVVGGLFNKLDKPPTYGQFLDDGAVTGRGIFSRNGHRITFHDADDIGGIILRVDDDNHESVVSIGLNSLETKLVVQSKGAVDIDAEGEVTIRGSKITLQADGDLVLKGTTIKLN